jgi:hypothetical protein
MFPFWIWVIIAFAGFAAASTLIFGYFCSRSSKDDEIDDFHVGRKDSRYTESLITPADGTQSLIA